MSATIKYHVMPQEDPIIPVSFPSAFINIITDAFGMFPVTLTEKDLPVLKGIIAAHCHYVDTSAKSVFLELRNIIIKNKTIRLYAEY